MVGCCSPEGVPASGVVTTAGGDVQQQQIQPGAQGVQVTGDNCVLIM